MGDKDVKEVVQVVEVRHGELRGVLAMMCRRRVEDDVVDDSK
jgi:hypothetical protein